METRPKKYTFHALDAIRGLAAATVVLYHFTVYTTGVSIFPAGQFAVDLFYCLSGFVMAHSYEQRMRDGMTIARFFKIRLIRFYPYYALGAILGIGEWIVSRIRSTDVLAHSVTIKMFLVSVLTTLCFLPSSGLTTTDADNLFPFNFPTWSLFLELIINMVYIAGVFRMTTRWLLALVAMLGIALAALIFHYHSSDIGFTHTGFMGGVGRAAFSFFMGVFLRRIWKPEFSSKFSYLWLLAAFMVCISIPATRELEPFYDLLVICTIVPNIVFWGAVLENGTAQVGSLFQNLGKTSFGLYALHVPIFAAFVLLTPKHFSSLGPMTSILLGIVALAVLVALVQQINVLFDQPIRKRLTLMFLSDARPTDPTLKT